MRAIAAAIVVIALSLPGCAVHTPAVEFVPDTRRAVATFDLQDLFEGPAPLFTGVEAADRWAHRSLDRSCWSEGIPGTEWSGKGVLTVHGHQDAIERLTAEILILREAAR